MSINVDIKLRNIGAAKYIVCPTNPTFGRATARLAHYVPAPIEANCNLLLRNPTRRY